MTFEASQAAIAQVEQHANAEWKVRALASLRELCERQRYVCSDDLVLELSKYQVHTHTLRAIGAVFQKAKREGYCTPSVCDKCNTVTMKRTEQKSLHGHAQVIWKSLIFSDSQDVF